MKVFTRTLIALAILVAVALPCLAASSSTPVTFGQWKKLTGPRTNFSGVPDGILPDIVNGVETDGRQNSYAWCLEILNGYLYVGTSRDIVGLVLRPRPDPWPADIPIPTDIRGRIFRMKISTGEWERVYVADPTSSGSMTFGPDMGYRMMKTFKAAYSDPVLYVGGAGFGGSSRMLAIDTSNQVTPIFEAKDSGSVRAMAIQGSQFFWASDYKDQPEIFYSSNPLRDFRLNRTFNKIQVPSNWFPKGAEILDIVPYNNALYVFFFDHNWSNPGFWCAKLQKILGDWKWRIIVGDNKDPQHPPLYPKGMGRGENGGATPFIFKGKMYVGTISTTMWRYLVGDHKVDPNNVPPTGTQIFRFGTDDKWERVMPPAFVKNDTVVSLLNGFANPLNLYLWRFAEQNGKLYAGTFDARTALEMVDLSVFGLNLDDLPVPLWNPQGFDLYSTTDGVTWIPESLNGFGDKFNYGARTLFTDPQTGDLYLGTANPFYGCQVWVKAARKLRFGM